MSAALSLTTNPLLIGLVVLAVCYVVIARRSDAPWALSFKFYLYMALLIIAIRIVFRILVGGAGTGPVLFTLPQIPLPEVARGITLLGPVHADSLLAGVYDGMRLAGIVLCIGAANTLANPKRLLKSMPPALYEVGTAIVVALTVFPQLAESVQRVRKARLLRGDPGKGVGGLRRIVVPVMEDALERSMALAAGMDARGYGRSGTATRRERWWTGAVMLVGLGGIAVGVYGFLDATAPRWMAWPMLGVGTALAIIGFVVAGRRVQRTRYRPDRWRAAEIATALCGATAACVAAAVSAYDRSVMIQQVSQVPTLVPVLLLIVVAAVLPAFITPPPVLASRSAAPRKKATS